MNKSKPALVENSPNPPYSPNITLVTLYLLNNLNSNIGIKIPQAITTSASGTNTYHRSLSSGSFLNTAFAKPSKVVWKR